MQNHRIEESQKAHPIQWLVLGAAAGALTAFILDPHRGRRRRALLRDQYTHYNKVADRYAQSKWIHFQNVLRGWQVEKQKQLSTNQTRREKMGIRAEALDSRN